MATTVEASITGTVFAIETQVGAAVGEGDTLIVVESMKMELPVEAPEAGTVAEIMVTEGQTIEEGDALVRLE